MLLMEIFCLFIFCRFILHLLFIAIMVTFFIVIKLVRMENWERIVVSGKLTRYLTVVVFLLKTPF